jgi:hypothetical protein
VPINFKKHKIKENKTDDDMNISDELNETKFEINLKEILISDYIEKKINENRKKYTKTKLIFEGEYLYNYRRKGKAYYIDGKLSYEGELSAGKQYRIDVLRKEGNTYKLKTFEEILSPKGFQKLAISAILEEV